MSMKKHAFPWVDSDHSVVIHGGHSAERRKKVPVVREFPSPETALQQIFKGEWLSSAFGL